jgi:GTP-binding protein LepA
VDATQGVQAQTLTTLDVARQQNLVIVPALSKCDVARAQIDEVKLELAELLDIDPETIIETSGKTGAGVKELMNSVIEKVPAPEVMDDDHTKMLVVDFHYDNHKGVVIHGRVISGTIKKNEKYKFAASNKNFGANDVGIFRPQAESKDVLQAGQIGYIVTGIKEPGVAAAGDTIVKAGSNTAPLSGYKRPQPVVWASVYPESQDDFDELRQSLDRLRLSDSSLQYEEESSGALGRGFRCGFLGMLHLEIVTERLRREFNLELIVTSPSISYSVKFKDGKQEIIYAPSMFPDSHDVESVEEPMATVTVITPHKYMSDLVQIFHEHEATTVGSETRSDGRMRIQLSMPLRELMRGFFDRLKSASSGYASISYTLEGSQPADVARLDLLVAEEPVAALSRIIPKYRGEQEARSAVEKLYEILPRQQFVTKIQAVVDGKILASKTLSALRKDVTANLYGGDITRKMKLREKQKKGKKKLAAQGKVNIPQDVFMKMIRVDQE